MTFDSAILIITGYLIEMSQGYVSGVNPKLVSTKLTTFQPHVDFKMKEEPPEGSTSHQNLVKTTSSYDDSRIIFPSEEKANERTYSQVAHDQTRDGTAMRSFPIEMTSNHQKMLEAHLSRYSTGYNSGHLFERDEDDDRPIWNN